MPLTDAQIKAFKPDSKAYKRGHRDGLYLLVHPNGSKYWRLKYRIAGKEKTLALGVYPDVTLKAVGVKVTSAKELIADGVDPSAVKQLDKIANKNANDSTFKSVALEWHSKQAATWSDAHSKKVKWILGKIIPYLGTVPINEIKPAQLLTVLQRIESEGRHETANRTKMVAGQVFRYAVATGRAERDPAHDLKGALITPQVKHRAAITEVKDIPLLLVALESYDGTPIVSCALRLAPLLFVRPGELRQAQWSEIDWQAAEWRYKVSKTDSDHIVPLSAQALEILREVHVFTGQGRYVFPSARSNPQQARNQRPMSENAINFALRAMGITKDQMCGHGFRAMARTVLDEVLGFRIEWIEQQLAHAVKDVHGRAYNRTAHLEQRKDMMQKWADYLEQLRLQV